MRKAALVPREGRVAKSVERAAPTASDPQHNQGLGHGERKEKLVLDRVGKAGQNPISLLLSSGGRRKTQLFNN